MPSVNLARLVLLEARRGALPWLAAAAVADEHLPRRVPVAGRAHRKPHAAGGDRRRGAARLRRVPRRGARLPRACCARSTTRGSSSCCRCRFSRSAHYLGRFLGFAVCGRADRRVLRPAAARLGAGERGRAVGRVACARGGAGRGRGALLRHVARTAAARDRRQARGSICLRAPWRASRPSRRDRTATSRSPTASRAGRWTALRCSFPRLDAVTRTEWLLYGAAARPPSTSARSAESALYGGAAPRRGAVRLPSARRMRAELRPISAVPFWVCALARGQPRPAVRMAGHPAGARRPRRAARAAAGLKRCVLRASLRSPAPHGSRCSTSRSFDYRAKQSQLLPEPRLRPPHRLARCDPRARSAQRLPAFFRGAHLCRKPDPERSRHMLQLHLPDFPATIRIGAGPGSRTPRWWRSTGSTTCRSRCATRVPCSERTTDPGVPFMGEADGDFHPRGHERAAGGAHHDFEPARKRPHPRSRRDRFPPRHGCASSPRARPPRTRRILDRSVDGLDARSPTGH